MDALLSEYQIVDIARDMEIQSTKTLYLEEKDEVVIITKDERSKIEMLKKAVQIGVMPYYLEDEYIFQLSISSLGELENTKLYITANIPINQPKIYETLKQAIKTGRGVEFYSVSDDLEVISIRRVATEPISITIFLKQLERYQNKENL